MVQVTAAITTPTGTLTATSSVTVAPPPVVRVGAVRYGVAKNQLHVYVTLVDTRGRRVRDASVTAALYRNGKVYARALGSTTAGNMLGGALGLAVLASIAAARTDTLTASGENAADALNGGYQLAFLAGALFAALAATLGGLLFRVARPAAAGAHGDGVGSPATAKAD